MSELPRRIVSQLRRFFGNRRRTKRAEVRLSFELRLGDPRTSSNGTRRVPSLVGHTHDISMTGLGLVVPAIRIGEHYLAGTDRRLFLQLDLPGGPVEVQLTPVRYESLEDSADEQGYLIGARIVEMSADDRSRYEQYVVSVR